MIKKLPFSIFHLPFADKKGFTIIELLIYLGLFTMFLTVTTTLFASGLDASSQSEAGSAIEQDGRFIISRLSYDIKRSQSIVVPSTLGGQSSSLQLTIASQNNAYSIDQNHNFILTNNLGVNALNSYDSSVSSFLVTRLGNVGKVEDTLKIIITLQSKTKTVTGVKTKTFQTTVAKRR